MDRKSGAAARFSLVGAPRGLVQELPVWMLDASAYRSMLSAP
jgi:hypothetical protein